MNKRNAPKKPSQKTPFFARFLEKQELDTAAGGAQYVTLKYPSDSEDDDCGNPTF